MLQGYFKEKTPAVVMPETPLQLAVESKEKGDISELSTLFKNLVDALGLISGCLPEGAQRDKAAEAMEGLQNIIKTLGGHGTITQTLDKTPGEECKEAIAATKLRTEGIP